MPAAKNTNNFWNLGAENRGLSRVHATRTGIFVHSYADFKKTGINAHESRRIRKIWRDARGRVPNFAIGDFGVFSSLPRRSPATAGRKRVFWREIPYLRTDSFTTCCDARLAG